MKRIYVILLTAAALAAPLAADVMPCSAPPFVANSVPPNLVIMLDNSGSMAGAAYWKKIYFGRDTLWWNNSWTLTNHPRYYGYFYNDSLYEFAASKWSTTTSTTNSWPGWLLNWATTSKTDCLRKVLIGGQYSSNQLAAEGGDWEKRLYGVNNRNRNTFIVNLSGGVTQLTITRDSVGPVAALAGSNPVKITAPTPFRGVINQIADKNGDGVWDDNVARFGLWDYDAGANGGNCVSYINDPTLTDLVNAIQNIHPGGYTPLAECYTDMLSYFAQINSYYGNHYTANPGGVKDPFYDKKRSMMVPCIKSFVLFLTDGQSTQDRNVPTSGSGLPGDPNLRTYYNDSLPVPWAAESYSLNGSAWLDDVALYGHNTDLRPGLAGTQNCQLAVVFCFGQGGNLLRSAAKAGSFTDKNGNGLPDLQEEWDTDGDGVPDFYFEADNGWELEDAIMRAILAIMARAASATAVSVVSGSSTGEGTMTQAYFQQAKYQGTDELWWSGYLRALWVDRYGNIREDTNQDGVLTMTGSPTNSDLIVRMYNDAGANATMDSLFYDSTGTGTRLGFVRTVPLDGLMDLWNAGNLLYAADPANRQIFTFADADNDGIVESGEIVPLDSTNQSATLAPYMGLTADTAGMIINYVRGAPHPGWRPRELSGATWKLGDIINSTPAYAARPTERYDQLYGDASYAQFYNYYRYRRNVVMVGSNDGMIHCFNAGRFVPNTSPGSVNKGSLDPMSRTLGEELWAYVPKAHLPQLKWLPRNDYCHVYYNDLKVKLTDAKLWPATDTVHVGGWGTVAIVGMRLGGTPDTVGTKVYKSSYVCFDITNPDACEPMWEITVPNLDYTVSYPCVAVFDSAAVAASPKFYVVFGGGPTTMDGSSAGKTPNIYVVNMATGALVRSIPTYETDCAVGDPVSVDFDLNYKCDVMYFGTYSTYSRAQGMLYRLTCRTGATFAPNTESDNPANWSLDTLYDCGRPVSAAPAVTIDESGHRWVYWGTGRYFSDMDEVDTTDQYIFGVKDDNFKQTRYATELRDVSPGNVDVRSADSVRYYGAWMNWRSFVNAMSAYKGWVVKLPQSGNSTERVINKPAVIGGAVLLSSFQPQGDPCAGGGLGYLYALYYTTGTAYYNAIIPRGSAFYNPISLSTGVGQPSAPALHVGSSGGTAFLQTPTGVVLKIGTVLPFNPKSGTVFWKQQ